TRQQFWEFAAFFSGIQAQGPNNVFAPGREMPDSRKIKLPNSSTEVEARFLSGEEPQWESGTSTRSTLARWLTATDNPYFTRTHHPLLLPHRRKRAVGAFLRHRHHRAGGRGWRPEPAQPPGVTRRAGPAVRRPPVRFQIPHPRHHRQPGVPAQQPDLRSESE